MEESALAEAALRAVFASSRRLVIKLGSRVVIGSDGGAALDRLESVVARCVELMRQKKEVLLVSSGAVGLGRRILKIEGTLTLREKQACAAVGQAHLVQTYNGLFSKYGVTAAQVLLTADDFSDRAHYLNLKDTLDSLLEMGVVPVINENDTVSTAELESKGRSKSFGDNDTLSALVAGKAGAQALVILTDVDGIYDDNPSLNPKARHISLIPDFAALNAVRNRGKSGDGRGGMASKVHAARVAAICGVSTVITSGMIASPLKILPGDPGGPRATLVVPQGRIREKKRWIGHSSGYAGVVKVNPGAADALEQGTRSLLPVGITGVEGRFSNGAIVSVQTEEGREIGRGRVNYSSEEIRKIMGRKTSEARGLVAESSDGKRRKDEVVHKDDLVVFKA